MRSKLKMPPKSVLVAGTALALGSAGVAEAASDKLHHVKVDAPDGGEVEVAYTGDVAPEVRVIPARDLHRMQAAPGMVDPFVQMQRISAAMDARMHAMMQRAALVQKHAAALQARAMQEAKMTTTVNGREVEPGFAMASELPKGVQMTYFSSSTDAQGCTRSVSYSSDGSGGAPKMVQAASDGCEAAAPTNRTIPAKAEAPAPALATKDTGRTV